MLVLVDVDMLLSKDIYNMLTPEMARGMAEVGSFTHQQPVPVT